MPKVLTESIPNRVREIRKSLGLRIQDLHERSKVAAGHISDIETGKKTPGVRNAQRLAAALGVTVEEAFPPQDRELVQSEVIR